MELEDVWAMLKDAYEEGFRDCANYSDSDLVRFLEDNWNNSSLKTMIKEWNL